jgi:hypothetical protein
MQKRWLMTTLSVLLMTGLVVVMTLFKRGGLVPSIQTFAAHAAPGPALLTQGSGAQVAGGYSGVVQLQVAVAGRYSDTLNTQPGPNAPDLGSIDLALQLNQSGTVLSGYVSLDKTLVFTVEQTIQVDGVSVKIGPTVNGSFDGTSLTLLSARVATTLSGQALERQFRLAGTISQSDGSQITGEYRETLWGAARQPITVIGTFTLQRPVFDGTAPDTSNKAPDPVVDRITTARGVAVTVSVLTNDTDANGDALTITSVSKPQFGTATTDGQRVTYTPNANFVGEDHFTYVVSDGKGGTAAGSVTITVTGDGPVGNSTLYLPLIQR